MMKRTAQPIVLIKSLRGHLGNGERKHGETEQRPHLNSSALRSLVRKHTVTLGFAITLIISFFVFRDPRSPITDVVSFPDKTSKTTNSSDGSNTTSTFTASATISSQLSQEDLHRGGTDNVDDNKKGGNNGADGTVTGSAQQQKDEIRRTGDKQDQKEQQQQPPSADVVSSPATILKVGQQEPEFKIVCQLSGEMGNQLSHLAHCRSIQLWLEREYSFRAGIVLKHQDASKWTRARDSVVSCYPNIRGMDFEEGNTKYYGDRKDANIDWLRDTFNEPIIGKNMWRQSTMDVGINQAENVEKIEQSLAKFVNLTQVAKATIPHEVYNHTIPIPFLFADHLAHADIFVDKYSKEIQDYLRFDYDSCCKLRPDPDESVFHFRNFGHEMGRNAEKKGFSELDPNQTVTDIFGHLKSGDKVAIVTRFSVDFAKPYMDALQDRGINVRLIPGQSGTEDFCFLMSAQKEMMGIVYSTYLFWAGILSQKCKHVLAYSLYSKQREKSKSRTMFVRYNWTDPVLRDRFEFKLVYPADQVKNAKN